MSRIYFKQLQKWKDGANRKPLLLWGARQVGKTHLMKSFAALHYTDHIYLNFEVDQKLASLFEASLDPEAILKKLSLYFNRSIDPRQCLLIFDEIQECENALNSLKYFEEAKQDFHIISAGSLLGVKLSKKGFPVGKVEIMDIYPLSFLEFLNMTGDDRLAQFLDELNVVEPIPEAIHQKLLAKLADYQYVGGMPEVVAAYAENPMAYQRAREIQINILRTYELDFAKHAPKEQVVRISEIFAKVPQQLAKENKKFIFSAIAKSARARDYTLALQWLKDARIILPVTHVSRPEIPLLAHADTNIFKIYFLDVGLLGALLDVPSRLLVDHQELFASFRGALAENSVAQELTAQKMAPLFYWTSSGTAEVDFLLQYSGRVLPLEVKSGINVKLRSLQVYAEKYACKTLSRCSILNFRVDGLIVNYPLYAVSQIPKLVDR